MKQVEQEQFEDRNDGAAGRNVRIYVAPAQRPVVQIRAGCGKQGRVAG